MCRVVLPNPGGWFLRKSTTEADCFLLYCLFLAGNEGVISLLYDLHYVASTERTTMGAPL